MKNDTPEIDKLLDAVSGKSQSIEEKTRLISAFGKHGYMRLSNSFIKPKHTVCVEGKYGSQDLFFARLLEMSRYRRLSFVRFPSPLSDKITEAIYYTDTDFLIIADVSGKSSIDTGRFLNERVIEENRDLLEFCRSTEEELLSRAASEFYTVSDIHFTLEKIYTKAMNFSETDRVFKDIKNEILSIL
jgi:hypothetical protein